ncbi:MAG: hypothetical protein PVI91_02180 [Gammaproteobacteria bacterium]|jgi:hypothetical protein
MSGSDGEAQARERLVEVVERHRREKCEEVLGRAARQAGELVTQAFREARGRARQGIADVRLQYRHRIEAARAKQHTQRRQRRQRDNSELLAQLWEPLRAAVHARWQEPEARAAWIEALAGEAESRLRDTSWTVEHPPDWPESEQRALRERVAARLRFAPQATMSAGLRICAAGACVDGSVEGLLRDRRRVESLLLARLIERGRKEQAGQGRS